MTFWYTTTILNRFLLLLRGVHQSSLTVIICGSQGPTVLTTGLASSTNPAD